MLTQASLGNEISSTRLVMLVKLHPKAQEGFRSDVWSFITVVSCLTGDFFVHLQQNRDVHAYSSPFASCPAPQRIQSSRMSHLAAVRASMELQLYSQSCHSKESQLWELVLLGSPINGGSYRNLPLSRFVRVSVEKMFSVLSYPNVNWFAVCHHFIYLLQKLSPWLMTLHSCMPTARMEIKQAAARELSVGGVVGWIMVWLVQNSQQKAAFFFSLQFYDLSKY